MIDYNHPLWIRLYCIIWGGVQASSGVDQFGPWLRSQNLGRMTQCPMCGKSDFQHLGDCTLLKALNATLGVFATKENIALATDAIKNTLSPASRRRRLIAMKHDPALDGL